MSKVTFNRTTDLYNMILGGLIALYSDQNIGKLARKTTSENVFLGKWLKRAKKLRCYPKTLSEDIDNFLRIYSREGLSGDLASLFRHVFREFQLLHTISQEFSQTDKQRFDMAMEVLAEDGWHISLPINHCKDTDAPYRPVNNKEIFTTKWYLNGAFNDENKIIKPFSIFVVSTPQKVIDCLYEHGFILVEGLTSHDDKGNDYYQYQLFPDNDCLGNLVIPSKFQN